MTVEDQEIEGLRRKIKELQVENDKRRRRIRTALATNALAMLGVSAAVYFALATMSNWLPVVVNGYYRWVAL